MFKYLLSVLIADAIITKYFQALWELNNFAMHHWTFSCFASRWFQGSICSLRCLQQALFTFSKRFKSIWIFSLSLQVPSSVPASPRTGPWSHLHMRLTLAGLCGSLLPTQTQAPGIILPRCNSATSSLQFHIPLGFFGRCTAIPFGSRANISYFNPSAILNKNILFVPQLISSQFQQLMNALAGSVSEQSQAIASISVSDIISFNHHYKTLIFVHRK